MHSVLLFFLSFQCSCGFINDFPNINKMQCPDCQRFTCFSCKKPVRSFREHIGTLVIVKYCNNILVVVHCFSSGRTNMKGSVVNSLLGGKKKMTKNINKLDLLDILLVMASVSVKF